jgi:hypothetical protein
MYKTMLIAAFLAAASFNVAMAEEPIPKKRTAPPAITFDEALKKIDVEITVCKRIHGVMTKIASATMQGGALDLKGEISLRSIDTYPLKVAPTAEQLKSLKGKPICDPN